VSQYVLDDISEDGKTFILLTEQVENAPSGTKAKLIFTIMSKDGMEQSFHVAWPGKEFSCFFVHKLMRKKWEFSLQDYEIRIGVSSES
jgi:hypothetical protein